MNKDHIAHLLKQYLEGTLEPEGQEQLKNALKDGTAFREVLEKLLAENKEGPEWDDKRLDLMVHAIVNADKTDHNLAVKKMPFISWTKLTAAASMLIILSTGAYFMFFNKEQKQTAKTEVSVKDVEAPKVTKATITLANGQNVYLDSVKNGILALQGNVKLVKLANGQIVYHTESGEVIKEIQYNTLTNPRGSQVVNITLADGSKVWLNTASSLTYPIAFVGNARNVSITGEAYFEVKHDATKPFRVSKGQTIINVLGTHFNVNSYDDEDETKITLVEGSVEVVHQQSSLQIKPGQQVQIPNVSSGIAKMGGTVDIDQVMAWQRGIFELNNTELPVILRQVSRWYDLDIVYENKPGNEKFGGGISKNVPLSSMLKLLEVNGLKFTLEGKKLKVRT